VLVQKGFDKKKLIILFWFKRFQDSDWKGWLILLVFKGLEKWLGKGGTMAPEINLENDHLQENKL
jgi:hypothetical protein